MAYQDTASIGSFSCQYSTVPAVMVEKPAAKAPVCPDTHDVIYHVERIENFKEERSYVIGKRIFDFFAAIFALIITALPMLVIAIAIKLDSPGPVIFRQERLGKNGKPFTIHKFRSMRVDAEANGAQWATEGDPRVTKVGRFIRNSRLDEIPQFIDILAGKMSFIGPRPERECFYEEFEQYIDGFSQRLVVIPGLTGLAQVNGGYNLKPEEKIIYDVEYIKNHSLLMDLKIILKTIAIMFSHNGAR